MSKNRNTYNLTASHWGIYEATGRDENLQLHDFSKDPHPSPIGLSLPSAARGELRVLRPAVRRGWLEARERGESQAHRSLRGKDPMVEVSWETALDLVAGELDRIRHEHGNQAIYGSSYGWASAGRFHHAQSQIHRFLNTIGGYVGHAGTYSLGAARILLPHIVAPIDELFAQHTSWSVMAQHTELFVAFGGVPSKNAQVSSGGATAHMARKGLTAMAQRGTRFVNISPVRDNLDTGGDVEWIPIRPGTDTALALALTHVIVKAGHHDRAFLSTHCVGFEKVNDHLLGKLDGVEKNAAWASRITGIPAERIEQLADEIVKHRTMMNMSWSVQRAQYGEQTYWALITLASCVGQIGLPGGGFGLGYGTTNAIGCAAHKIKGPTLPQGPNGVADYIPVARVTDMLERPGQAYHFNGEERTYPDIRLIYWAGGNPFHHQQDLNKLLRAWRRQPETIVVHEQYWTATARLADIVLPATTSLEREDISFARRERYMVAMRQLMRPIGLARDDYEIFSGLAERLNVLDSFTEGRDARQWLKTLYDATRSDVDNDAVALPSFEEFWDRGLIDLGEVDDGLVLLDKFRENPVDHPLPTPSGCIELFSEKIAAFGYDDCPGYACWIEPTEWLGSDQTQTYPLHLVSDQPFNKLHSQLDHGKYSQQNKINGVEPVVMSPADADARGLQAGDIVRVFNERGQCLAGLRISEDVMVGVIRLSTGAWYRPRNWEAGELELNGNPNVLTLDVGTSSLAQGTSAQSCLVQVEAYLGDVDAGNTHGLPELVDSDL